MLCATIDKMFNYLYYVYLLMLYATIDNMFNY